jgi:hypothetical protein
MKKVSLVSILHLLLDPHTMPGKSLRHVVVLFLEKVPRETMPKIFPSPEKGLPGHVAASQT